MSISANHEAIPLKKLYELSVALSGDPMEVFAKVAEMIAEIMGVKVVCLSEIQGYELHFISVYANGKIHLNVGNCPLDITPCASVEASRKMQIYQNVTELFPDAVFLQEHNAYSYCGLPSLGHQGNVVAVTCLLDDQPCEFSEADKELLWILGQRIGAEIERKHLLDSRQAAVAALEYSEQRFHDIAQATGELLWEVDADGVITYLSNMSLPVLGCSASALIGKNIRDVVCVEGGWRDFAEFRKSTSAQRCGGGFEYKVRLGNGGEAWLLVKSVRVRDRRGKTIGYRGTACNITKLKHKEEMLILERNRLRRILDSLSVFIALVDCDGKVIEANRTPWVAAGIRREDYIGIQFGESRAWTYDAAVHAQVRLAVSQAQQGLPVRYDVPILMSNGIVTIDFSIVPLFDEQGRIEQMVACGVDISLRKNALEALRRSEERLELAILGADLGLWDWDIKTGAVVFSERWGSMLGYAPAEIPSDYAAWEGLVHPDDLANVRRGLLANLEGNTPLFELEYRLLAKNGEWRWTLGRGKVATRDAVGRPMRVLGIDLDIAAQKDLEARLRQQQEELYYAQRLTAAGELTAIMAHELNQPLGAINNYVGGALLRFHDLLLDNPSLAEVLDQTLRLSQRATAVIHGIRALVRKQESKLEWVALESVADEILALLRTEISRKQITVGLDIPSGLPPVWCEKVHLQQLLLNLILNAVQAMDSPECHWRKLMLNAKLNTNHKLDITISDTGPGIDPELAKRLFEPFFSTKSDGIGLGLSICRSIAEAYGGSISVQSIPRQGTVFYVVLPLGSEE
ncbi:MAG: PAS domain S-box protein [Candidatus Methylumidiphilus sp.]